MTDDTTTPTTEDATSTRQRAIEAYESARDRAADTLGEAPLLVLAGGIAAGALIAALLPRTDARSSRNPPDGTPSEGHREGGLQRREGHRSASGSTTSGSAARRARRRSATCSRASRTRRRRPPTPRSMRRATPTKADGARQIR